MNKGCPVCGGKLTYIRGKYPKTPKREVCPTCLAERMDSIHDMSDPFYGVAYEAKIPVEFKKTERLLKKINESII